jgi:hypothetical protein
MYISDNNHGAIPLLSFTFRMYIFHRIGFRPELINIIKNHDNYYKRSGFILGQKLLYHYRYTKRLRTNSLVNRCGINPSVRSLVLPIMMSKLILDPE